MMILRYVFSLHLFSVTHQQVTESYRGSILRYVFSLQLMSVVSRERQGIDSEVLFLITSDSESAKGSSLRYDFSSHLISIVSRERQRGRFCERFPVTSAVAC